VGYSAGLLDYFFRGTLEISFPTAAVYSIADGSKKPYTANGNQHQTFTKIKASVMNTTPNNEAIRAGELRAVARYKIIPNYAADLSNYPPDGLVMAGNGTTTYPGVPYSYSVSEATEVVDGDIIPGYYTDCDFDFSNAPIPAGITDLTLQVVFKGTIGNEIDNAIAVGMMDLMEPTHITFWNLTDGFSIPYPGAENKLYTFGQLQGLAAQNSTILSWLDKTPAGSPNGSLNDEYILQALSSSFMISFWDGYGWIPAMDGNGVDISPSGYIRMIVLVDDPANNYAKLAWNNPYYTDEFYYSFPGVVNQVSQNGSYPIPTNIYPFRKASGTLAPIIQHWFMGNGYCATGPTHEVGLCSPDPYYNADPAVFPVSAAPIPFTSQFNQ